MNVLLMRITVTRMLPVLILWEVVTVTIVPVTLDTLEMEPLAQVNGSTYTLSTILEGDMQNIWHMSNTIFMGRGIFLHHTCHKGTF